MKGITISAGSALMDAELNDGPTATKVWNALPIEARANRGATKSISRFRFRRKKSRRRAPRYRSVS